MFLRLPLLLAVLLSLAFGPVQLAAACAMPVAMEQSTCMSCCAAPEEACCVSTDRNVPAKAPDSIAPQSVDGKLIVTPVLMVVGVTPLPVVERPAVYKRQAALVPLAPRLAVTCIRLI